MASDVIFPSIYSITAVTTSVAIGYVPDTIQYHFTGRGAHFDSSSMMQFRPQNKDSRPLPMQALYARKGLRRKAKIAEIREIAEAPDMLMAALSISVSVIGPDRNAVSLLGRCGGAHRKDCSVGKRVVRNALRYGQVCQVHQGRTRCSSGAGRCTGRSSWHGI